MSEWQRQDQQEHQNEDEPFHARREINQKHSNAQYQGLAMFLLVVLALIVFKVYADYNEDVDNGRFYKNELMSLELIDFWKLTAEEMEEEQSDKEKKILDVPQHQISRQELGHNSWTLLHMVTGGFPENIPPFLVKKFNAFLVLFGQMYPCKLCANHFMQLLEEQGLFEGTNKKELMEYLCMLHNKVNERLGHPTHNCDLVYEEWNTCGCSQA